MKEPQKELSAEDATQFQLWYASSTLSFPKTKNWIETNTILVGEHLNPKLAEHDVEKREI